MLLLALTLACRDAKDPGDTSTTDTADTADAVPSFATDVRPLLDQHCARCHTDGAQAPSFDDASVVQAKASMIVAYVESGRMPPPAPNPACQDYKGSDDFTLSDDEEAVLAAWSAAGAPIDDPVGPSVRAADPVLVAPDATLRPAAAYTPNFSTNDNDYRCFLLDMNNDAPVWVTGFEALVDDLSIVHHVVLFDPLERAVRDDDGDLSNGFPCDGFGENGWAFLVGWAPGQRPTLLPEGMGMPMPAEKQLVLQMHYFKAFEGAGEIPDQSGYALTWEETPLQPVFTVPVGADSFTIPAGEEDYEVSDVWRWNDRLVEGVIGGGFEGQDWQILSVWPHMHIFGSGFSMSVTHESEERCLVELDGWDFHNQLPADYLTPTPLPLGSRIDVSCFYNNSASNPLQPSDPPQAVPWGEETTQEMCFGFTLVTPASE